MGQGCRTSVYPGSYCNQSVTSHTHVNSRSRLSTFASGLRKYSQFLVSTHRNVWSTFPHFHLFIWNSAFRAVFSKRIFVSMENCYGLYNFWGGKVFPCRTVFPVVKKEIPCPCVNHGRERKPTALHVALYVPHVCSVSTRRPPNIRAAAQCHYGVFCAIFSERIVGAMENWYGLHNCYVEKYIRVE